MKVQVPALAFCLVIFALFAAVPQPDGSRAQTCGAVKPEVFDALDGEPQALVFVSLPAPAVPSGGAELAGAEAAIAGEQAAVLDDLTASDFTLTFQYGIVPALSGLLTISGAAKLDCHPGVLAVDLDTPLTAALTESAPLVDAPQAHLQRLDGTGVDVAVFDTGIDTDHPDLAVEPADSLIGEACFTDVPTEEGVFVVCPDDPSYPNPSPGHPAEDGNGHGTHVSGIITSDGLTPLIPRGVAPGANIFAYKVILDSGSLFLEWLAAGLDDALQNHQGRFEFINMSIETPGQSYQPEQCDGDDPSDVYPGIAWIVAALRNTGTLAFAASGNWGSKAGLSFPACIPQVVSVGAVYDANIGSHSWPTCTDATTAPDKAACGSQSSDTLDLLAPGCEILSTWPSGFGAAPLCGTSMASPHAVAVAALIKQARPDITPDQLVQVLKDTGVPVTDDYDPQHVRTRPRTDAQAAALAVGGIDSSGMYHVLQELVPAGQDPGQYFHCLADVERDGEDNLTARTYCYVDIPGVPVNPEAGQDSGDGFPYVDPPAPYGDVDDQHAVLTGSADEGQNTITLSGCLEDRDGEAALGNVYVEWLQQQWEPPDLPSGEGTVSMWTLQSTQNCLNDTPAGDPLVGVLQTVRLGDEGAGHDFDNDNCPDEDELTDEEEDGGLRDPYNHWDFFNPTHDGQNRVDDILKVVGQYFCDDGTCPDYTKNTDRWAVVGANPWNLGPPNGQQRVDDILAAVKSYFHDCSGGEWIDDDIYPN